MGSYSYSYGPRAFSFAAILLCGISAAQGQTSKEFDLRTQRSTPSKSSTPSQPTTEAAEFIVVQLRRTAKLGLFWQRAGEGPYRTIGALERALSQRGKRLQFAANSGIYEPDLSPTGLHIEAGRVLRPLNLEEGAGNFYLRPNGVFAVTAEGGAEILPSRDVRGQEARFRLAVQSGPLLLSHGVINPLFRADSKNLAIRSGVGITGGGGVVFVLSKSRVNFHSLAAFMRNELNCSAALYLDGAIAEFHAPQYGLLASDQEFAGILGIVEDEAKR